MATHTFITNDYARKDQIMDLQVSTNTIVRSVDQIQEKVIDVKDKMDSALLEIEYKAKESSRNHEEIMEGLGTTFSHMGRTLTEIKGKTSQPDKPIPTSFILPSSHISILSPVHKPSEIEIVKRFPLHFPPEEETPESSSKSPRDHHSLVTIKNPSYENLPHHTARPSAPDLVGKGRLPESQTFADDWFQEWNIDNLSIAQIRQLIDRMYVSYKIMCMKGKTEIEACKTIIQCFTGTLSKWWEVISSPLMISKMEAEVLKDEEGDIVYHTDGTPVNNMIGALTTLILEHWCGTENEIADKHEIVLMNMKCRKMSEYEQFHKEWTQRIFEVKRKQKLVMETSLFGSSSK
jgi:hypothetical protein